MEAMEEAYRELGEQRAANSPRIDILSPRQYVNSAGTTFPGAHMLKTMSAATTKYAVIRFVTDMLFWRESPGGLRRERTAQSQTPYSVTRGLILLFSLESGTLLAVLGEGHIRNLRVGGSAGLAARYLAKEDASIVGVLGTGFMARAHVEAVALARRITHVRVYSPNPEHRDRFVCAVSAVTNAEVVSVPKAEEAVKGSDIVILATNALSPVIKTGWLENGMHVTCVRHCEIAKDTYLRFDTIVLNSKQNFRVWHYESRFDESGELPDHILADYTKGYPPGDVNEIEWESLPDLPDLILARHPGRLRPEDVTCFDNSVGFGLQFAAVAGRVYEIARDRGIGKEVPKEYFPDLI
jgi:ornithine cyclodeaminase/alanine dehydrogenase-like protein (mu-crystallin family)